jgi:hypothetical protein
MYRMVDDLGGFLGTLSLYKQVFFPQPSMLLIYDSDSEIQAAFLVLGIKNVRVPILKLQYETIRGRLHQKIGHNTSAFIVAIAGCCLPAARSISRYSLPIFLRLSYQKLDFGAGQ